MSPFARFILIEAVIFTACAALSWISGFQFSIILTFVGSVIVIIRFIDKDTSQKPFFNRLIVIGFTAMIAGVLLAFI